MDKLKLYDMLGFCLGANTFYSAKRVLFLILALFIPGQERLNPGFNKVRPFPKENVITIW